MIKTTLLFSFFFFSFAISQAQPEDHPHHEKHYSDVAPIETDEVKIEIIRPHSQRSFSQFTVKIYNKTDDYILVKKHAFTFSSDEMGYGDKNPKEDIDFIEPHGDITRTIKVVGSIGFKVNELEIKTDSVFSRAPVVGTPTAGGEFKMKPDKNSIMMEPFAVTLKKWRFSPKELSADFKIRYRGESVGIVNESKIKIRREDGTVLENTNAKDKIIVIPPMATKTQTVVRPFAKGVVGKGESVYIVWDDALQESEATLFNVPGFTLLFDAAKTKKENK
ncbi:MAG TPA: hypothetical protein DCR04_08920 [Flavobacteriales bacterium]|nr:hypothetical protein [Flavobacteriales bacterium]